MKIYIYLILLLFMLLLIYKGIRININYAPKKIKFICIGALIAMALRYVALIIFVIVRNIRYLYLLKHLYFLNLLCIPIGAFIIIYILLRNDRIKFLYMFPVSIILAVIYGFLIYRCPVRLEIDMLYGYYMEFIKNPYIYIGYMLINVLFIVLIINIYKSNMDKIGIVLVIISSTIVILETILYLIGGEIFVNLILGDILWMVTLDYAISKLKRRGKSN